MLLGTWEFASIPEDPTTLFLIIHPYGACNGISGLSIATETNKARVATPETNTDAYRDHDHDV
jgi:hypothetical protein